MICSLFVFSHWLLEEQNNISSSRSSVDVGDDDLFSHTVCMEQGGVTMLRAVAKAKHTHTLSRLENTWNDKIAWNWCRMEKDRQSASEKHSARYTCASRKSGNRRGCPRFTNEYQPNLVVA